MTRIKLHQALHGYAEGHRELACSASLKPRDTKAMLFLSDVSGPGARIDDLGYLTGYPLADSGIYAFARTWTAPEMQRPGCVWTHTLLIDYADLARLASLADLLEAFVRPQSSDYSNYAKYITFECGRKAAQLRTVDNGQARKILSALYAKPNAQIVASRDEELNPDWLVTTIWSQQWPRLRRNFRFCTLAAADRSTDIFQFDLQLLSENNRAFRTRFRKAIDADSVQTSESWVDEAMADLTSPSGNGLRHFLRRIGGDVIGGRAAYVPLCKLHNLMEKFDDDPKAVVMAIELLRDELRAPQAREVRAIVADAAIVELDGLSDEVLDFLLEHLDLMEPSVVEEMSVKLGRCVLRYRPDVFASMLDQESHIGRISEKTIAAADTKELIDAFEMTPALIKPALEKRPELVTESAFWAQGHQANDRAISILNNETVDQSLAINAIIVSQRHDLAVPVVAATGPVAVLNSLNLCIHRIPAFADAERWIRAAAEPSAVAKFLYSSPHPSRQLLAAISRVLSPDDLYAYGEDPWLAGLKRAAAPAAEPDEIFLSAFLLARSLGTNLRNRAALAQAGFEQTYRATVSGRLSSESWQLLEPRLPWSRLSDRDPCQRIRVGVVDLFVTCNLSPEIFGCLTQDVEIFSALVQQAAQTWNGRSYIRRTRAALKESKSDFSAFIRVIDGFVR